jgi:PII-like signaling protein
VTAQRIKLTTHFGEHDHVGKRALGDQLLRICERHDVRDAILLRGAEGFGQMHHLHTDRLLSLSDDLPVVATALVRAERIDAMLADVLAVQRRGLISLERARVAGRDPAALGSLPGGPEDLKLTVHVGRRERVGVRPAFVAVCALLQEHAIAGATVLLGVDGLRDGRRARARLLSRNAEVPIAIVAVGDGARIHDVVPELTRMLRRPLVLLERVRICKRDGELVQAPPALPASDARGRALWQKLTVYSSHAATTVGGHPLHLEIVRRLRAGGAAGATCVNGVWSYHGAHAPHGERLLQLRRHAPVVTSTLDSPARAASSFATIDALTSEHGLVTSETVPALQALHEDHPIGSLSLADPSS